MARLQRCYQIPPVVKMNKQIKEGKVNGEKRDNEDKERTVDRAHHVLDCLHSSFSLTVHRTHNLAKREPEKVLFTVRPFQQNRKFEKEQV